MSPDRLDPDQRLLYDALHDIWTRQARKVMLAWFIIASIGTGITMGAVYQMRISLKQTAVVIKRLEERGDLDRQLVLHAAQEQQQAAGERAALEGQLSRLKGQIVRAAGLIEAAKTANNATERGISNRRYQRKKRP